MRQISKAGHTVGKNSDVRQTCGGKPAGYKLEWGNLFLVLPAVRFTYDIPISPLRDAEFMHGLGSSVG